MPLTELVAEHGSPGVRPRRGRLPGPGRRVPRRVRATTTSTTPARRSSARPWPAGWREEGLCLDVCSGGELAVAERAGLRPGPDRLPRQQQVVRRAAPRRRARRGPDHRRLVRRDRAAGGRGGRARRHRPGDGARDRRRRGAHPRVHRHRPRGPEVRLLDHQRADAFDAVEAVRDGAGPRAARAALAHRLADLRLLRLRGRGPAGARAARPDRRRSSASRCPRWTSAAASASPTPPRTTPPSPRSWPPR